MEPRTVYVRLVSACVRVLLFSWLPGCSLLSVPQLPDCAAEGRPDRCACVLAEDCARFSDACTTYTCGETRLCVAQERDDDNDGDPPAACEGGRDCDDGEPRRSGLLSELCDGLDNDCNGALDAPGEDQDQDGFASCGSAREARDCDDLSALTYPGAPELCDGVDNDCEVDGVVRVTGGASPAPEEDRDGDRHSAPDAPCADEGAPALFPRDDCDDGHSARFPQAFEACDGLDNDCDGVADGTPEEARPGAACVPTGLAVGARHACVLRRDGRVVCWGTNREGERAEAVSGVELPEGLSAAIPLEDQVEVVAGRAFGCSRSRDGEVSCWGSCAMDPGAFVFGVDDVGSEQMRCERTFRAAIVQGATALTAGRDHACATVEGGRVMCWGARPIEDAPGLCNPAGLLLALSPLEVVGAEGLTGLAAGGQQTCGIRDGRVFCFTFEESPAVREVAGLADILSVSCAGRECCALDADGEVSCFGPEPSEDQIPDADASCVREPPALLRPLASGVRRLWSSGAALERSPCAEYACGGGSRRLPPYVAPRTTHCVELYTGDVRCLSETSAAVGSGFQGSGFSLVTLQGVSSPRALGLGLDFGCALMDEGVSCWGRPSANLRGDGVVDWWNKNPAYDGVGDVREPPEPCGRTFGESRTCPLLRAVEDPRVPIESSLFAHPVQVATGGLSTCVRAVDGRAYCTRSIFGADTTGFLALGSDVVDVEVSGDLLRSLESISGYEVACMLNAQGQGSCSVVVRPKQILLQPGSAQLARHDARFTWPEAVDVEASQSQIYLRTADGEVLGSARRTLNRDYPDDLPFTKVPAAQRVLSFDCGRDHCCGRDGDGQVLCWGDGGPELGYVPSDERPTAQRVELPAPALDVAASGERSCAVLKDGTLWCWGAAFPAESAEAGGLAPRLLGQGAVAVALGDDHVCMRLRSGEVRCRGRNESGQLGVGGIGFTCDSTVALLEGDLLGPVAFPLPDPPETEAFRNVRGLGDARTLACGGERCCAGRESGQTVCWGHNSCNLGGPVVWTSFEPTPLVAPYGGLGVGIAYPDPWLTPLPAP